MPEPVAIPLKSHFKPEEVCFLADVKPYVLRFWESEFPEIRPVPSSEGRKLYRHRDVETVVFIKELLFGRKMSVEEAKPLVRRGAPSPRTPSRNGAAGAAAGLAEAAAAGATAAGEGAVPPPIPRGIPQERLPAVRRKLVALLDFVGSIKRRRGWD